MRKQDRNQGRAIAVSADGDSLAPYNAEVDELRDGGLGVGNELWNIAVICRPLGTSGYRHVSHENRIAVPGGKDRQVIKSRPANEPARLAAAGSTVRQSVTDAG